MKNQDAGLRAAQALGVIFGALVLLAGVPGRSATTATATILTASATSGIVPGDPGAALPDTVKATGQFLPSSGGSVTYEWSVVGGSAVNPVASGTIRNVKPGVVIPIPALSYTGPTHLAHFTYTVGLRIVVGPSAFVTATPKTATVPNLNPTVFALRWYQGPTPVSGATDTPLPASYTTRQSLVAAPADGTEADPGALLSSTAAAVDPDGDSLSFTFKVDGADQAPVAGVHPAAAVTDPNLLTARLAALRLLAAAGHTLSVRVDDAFGGGVAPSALSNTVPVLDPRSELREELRGTLEELGVTLGPGDDPDTVFQQRIAPALRSAQGEYDQAVSGSGSGAPHVLLRTDSWVESKAPLMAAEELRGEYFGALINLGDGRLSDVEHVNLALPLPLGIPTIYLAPELQAGKTFGTDFAFPRVLDVQEFNLPDQVYLRSHLLTPLFENTQMSLALGTPDALALRTYQNLADSARLFNSRTASILPQGAPAYLPPVHGPDRPRVTVYSAVRDGVTPPVVVWTFSDPHFAHMQAAVTVTVDGVAVPAADLGADGRSAVLRGLVGAASAGSHTVTVTVTDSYQVPGRVFQAARTVRFLVP